MKYESPKKRKQTTSLLKIQLNLDKKNRIGHNWATKIAIPLIYDYKFKNSEITKLF